MGIRDTKVTDEQINEVINDANDQIDAGGSRWPGMSYEQGVVAALGWVIGDAGESPFEEN